MKKHLHKEYKYLFFDLDRTLWDYRANSEQTLKELVNKYVPSLTSRVKEFLSTFYEINDRLWLDYRDGKIRKEELSVNRFKECFNQFEIDSNSFSDLIARDYIIEAPKKTALFPNTIDALEYLQSKNYSLFLLTNGFLEVQRVKIKSSRIEQYFERMITSEEAGYQKPDIKIFEYALSTIGAEKDQCIMIGDDLDNDISGAQKIGMDTVYFNPNKEPHSEVPTFEISNLNELISIF